MTKADECVLGLPGLEADNLLAFLALLGLLRSLEAARPSWRPRASWRGPPWRPQLHLVHEVRESEVADAAAEGVLEVAGRFDCDGRNDVKFERGEFRSFAARVADDFVAAALASAMTSEFPLKEDGTTYAAPLVFMFGQGHQHFLQRLISVSRGESPELRSPAKISAALFQPWNRCDTTDAFRWDPEEAQRYALRFDDPSRAGAAATVHGANRLAAIGLLSYVCVPTSRRPQTTGVDRADGVAFVWPLWSSAFTLRSIEDLLGHPALSHCDREKLAPFGVVEIMRAQRISVGKFLNVAHASPARSGAVNLPAEKRGSRRR